MKIRLTLGAAAVAAISVLVTLFAFGSTAGASHFRGNSAEKASLSVISLQTNAAAAAVICDASYCDPDGAFLANNGGFTQLTHPYTGVYCLKGKGIRSTNRSAMVTAEYGHSNTLNMLATTRFPATGCPQYWFEVDTINTSLPGLVDDISFAITVN